MCDISIGKGADALKPSESRDFMVINGNTGGLMVSIVVVVILAMPKSAFKL